jgi:hypothetical protein
VEIRDVVERRRPIGARRRRKPHNRQIDLIILEREHQVCSSRRKHYERLCVLQRVVVRCLF